MKELQNFVYKHMDSLKHHKRYLAMLTALSMLVTFIVPLILIEPADSMTKQRLMLLNDTSNMAMVSNLNNGQDGNNGYSKGQLSEVTLLIGDGVDWAQGCLDADDVIEAAKREYFIGIASDFCVFLEGDLKPKGADAEGRVAVGGNITFTGGYNYQLGAGDYTTMTALINTDNYNGVTNFAHAIVGGYVKKIHVLSTVGNGSLYYQRPDASSLYQTGSGDSLTVYYPESEDLYKRIAIGNATVIDTCQHMTWRTSNNWNAKEEVYNTSCEHDKFQPNELAQFYQADLIDFEAVFEWLKTQSEKLSNKTATGTSQVQDGVVTFTGPGQNSDAVTIYFDLEQWDSNIREVRFVDVPENANLVVNCGGNIVKIGSEYGAVNFSTSINGEVISIIDSSGTKVNANNRKESEQILYNFYECGTDLSNLPTTDHGDEIVPYSLFVNTNFNGTILAPYAIVASDKECRGHLSGSLIAQKFTGGLEFGYRPYRGGTDILGSTAGYVVPFNKFTQDGETFLSGASFIIKDENDKTVESWTSGEGTQYITLPSELDLEGGTDYTAADAVTSITHSYTVEEQSAPEGYIKTDEFYTIVITETIDTSPDALIRTESGTLPTRILVYLDLYKGEAEEGNLLGRRVVTIEDTYSDEGIIQRIVCIENESGKQYFVLDINSQDGSIKSVGVPTDSSVLEDDEVESVFDDMKVNYLKPEVLEDEETGDGTDGEGTDDSTEGEKSLFPEGYVEPTGLTATYGQTLSQITIPSQDGIGSWTWVDNGQNVGDVGTKTFRARFIPTVEGYTQQEVQLQITVEPATPTTPGPYTVSYGTYLYNIQLPSDANGSWSWADSNQTGNNLNTFSFQAKYTPNNNNYKAISVDVSVTFTKSDPSYNIPNNLTATYGQTLADVTLPYADNGTWSWQAAPTTSVGSAGTNTFVAVFTPNDTNYNTVTHTVQITVNKADPECTFPTDLTAIYGQTLQNVTLPPADNGRFEWEWSGDTVGNVGTHYKNLKFIPNDTNNYNTVTKSVAIKVEKADPNYTVPTGLTVTYGSKLSSVTLPSGWTWDAPDNDVPGSAGSTVNYSATFTPSDTNNYNIINEDITLTIVQATPTVNPVYDKEKTYTQFDALPAISITEGDTPGTIQWSDKNASKLKYGENVLEWVFTPTDSTNYETVTGTITITAEAIETTPIPITDSKTEEVIKYKEVNYYYDPTSMMIMPLPDETPKFINEYGLVFKKLDDNGNLLPGASISLQSGTITEGKWVENTELSKPTWDWENGTSSSATIPVTEIKVNELNVGVVYRFLETAAPSEDYEIAEPIYFMKVDDSTIIYTQNEDDLANTAAWTELNLNEGEYIIGMTDRGVYGAGITLVKTNSNGTVRLDGAEFELYAVGAKSDVLVYPLNDGEYFEFKNGEVNLYEWFNSVDPNTYNSEYVQNGYLKPGGYYLYEVNPPSQAYERPDGPLYFTVEERTDADGKTYYEVTADKTEAPDETVYEFSVDTSNNKENWAYGNAEGVSKIEVYVTGASEIILYENGFSGQTASVVDGVATFEGNIPSTITPGFKIQNLSYNNGLTVTKVIVYAPEVIPDDYDINSITVSASPAYVEINDRYEIGDGKDATISLGSEYANKQITKIEFDVASNSGEIQLKPNNSQIAQVKPSMPMYTYPEDGSINANLKTDGSGNFYVTWWWVTITGMRFYIEGMESSGETPDLTVSSLTAYYLNGSKATAASIDELTNRNDIVGMEVTLTGTGTGNINIGDAWTISGAKAGNHKVGVTDYKPETSVEDGDTSHLVNASGTTVTIKNEAQGQETNIIVKKSWVNDADFTQYRPSEIEVKLYRGTKADGSDMVYIGEINDDESLANFNGTVTLNASNNWQHTWEDLPSAYAYEKKEDGSDDFDKPIRYYYFAVETTVPDRYTVSYPTQGSTSGDYTITNTLDTINIPVEKKWKNSDGSTATPNVNTITVKLQKHNGSGYSDFLDKDGNPVTLVLDSDNNWLGEFTGIPEGEYQVVESVVPSGWNVTSKGYVDDKYVITNTQKSGALKLTKIWRGDNPGQRPEYINIKIYRTTTPPTNNNNGSGGGTTGGDNNVDAIPPDNSKHETVTEDYARLLQYSLYFYDANMCGDEVTENSVYSWRNDCHLNDEVKGGFHDAGDHAIFGLPEGFTASTLGWSYYEYKNTFDSLGLTNHFKIIMKEFCDFFTDSTTITNGEVTRFLYQKGDGGTDHSYWGAPETQPSRSSQMFYTTNGASDIAADYAAALAQYALIFPSDSNSQTYLETAEALFDFSTKYNTRTSEGASGFYWDGNGSCNDEQAWAAAWLYLATKDDSYKTACETKLNSCGAIPERGHFWDDVTLGAECVYNAHINPNSANASEWSKVTDYLNTYCTGDSYRVLNSWGSTRHNTLLQLAALVTDKNMGTTNYQDWCKSQMAYILGNNSIASNGNSSTCFVAGFASNSSKYPHHRAASGYASGETRDNSKYDTDGHVLLGALIGGPNAGGGYVDKMDGEDLVWQTNEVTIDYNAGLVGAAAALYSVYGTGNTVTEAIMKADGLEIKTDKTIYEEQAQAASVNIGELFSTSAMSFKRNAVSVLADNDPYVPIKVKGEGYGQTYSGNELADIQGKEITSIQFKLSENGTFKGRARFNDYSSQTNEFEVIVTDKTITLYSDDFSNGFPNEINNFTIEKYWISVSTMTITEIRFYYESEGPSITLNPTSKTAKIGDTFQITATGATNLDWSSDDPAVTVTDGNVTIVGMPTKNPVTITVADRDSTATASAKVTIEAMTLSLNPSSAVVGDKVNYSSNYDNAVIESGTGYSISDDTIIAESEGNHTVTAKAGNATATATLNVSELTITGGSSTIDVGTELDFNVNGQTEGHSFNWTSSNPDVLEIDETTGQAVALKSGQDIEITVVKDDVYTATYSLSVQKGALSISVNPKQIRVGKTAILSAFNNEGQRVIYSSSDESKATISGDTVTAHDAGTVTITGILGNEQPTCNLTIIPLPSITAPNGNTEEYILGIDQTLQLTASNILGTATWTSDNESVVVFEENVSGSNTIAIRSITNGESTITVRDTDGTTGTFKIFVKEIAVEPDIPEGLVMYKQVTLSAANLTQDGTWVITENLPLEDERGRKYYYYIEEVTDSGVVQGNGGKYIPISYSDNGFTLDENTVKEVSVTNKLTETIQGQLPSTGGSGVKTYYYFGGALMLLGIAGFTGLKRRERKRRKE